MTAKVKLNVHLYTLISVEKVSDLIKECRQSLAESLFVWTCQSPLSKDDTLILISYLEKVTVEADGSLDSVNLSLLMALLYCFDVSFLEQGTEDREGNADRFLSQGSYAVQMDTLLFNQFCYLLITKW